YGWRSAFVVTAIAGLAWVLVWRGTVDFSALVSSRQTSRVTLPDLRERRFWSIVASYALGALPIGPIIYLAPLYLARVQGLTQSQVGRVLWIPPLGWEVGYFVWGWFIDRYAANQSRPTWLFLMLAALSLPLTSLASLHNTAVVLAVMFWCMFVA